MTNLSFYNNRKIRKTAGILGAIVKATAVVIGVVIAELAIAVFLSPRPVHAEESQQQIDGVLKEEGRFEYRRNNLLIEGLKKQKDGKRFIDCDDYSSIYLFAGERLGLYLEPVYVPRHVFLRCRLDDYSSFYWEPTIAAEKDAGFYKDWLNIPDKSSYPKILDEKEFEAIHLSNLGVAWYEKGDYAKVIEYSERAIRLDPKYAAAFSNIGVTFYRLGYLQKAVEYFEKAIELDPQFDQAYDNKVIVLMENGEHNRALIFANKIHDLKQRNARHLRN